jgi:hypothetical protein
VRACDLMFTPVIGIKNPLFVTVQSDEHLCHRTPQMPPSTRMLIWAQPSLHNITMGPRGYPLKIAIDHKNRNKLITRARIYVNNKQVVQQLNSVCGETR